MRIKKIEHNEELQDIVMETSSNKVLYPVILTISKWFKESKIKAYPTSVGPTFGGNLIRYFIYVDEDGNKLNDRHSERINQWCHAQSFEYKSKNTV
jgi:hypothetical protein